MLLPKGNGLPLIARLDECLQGINEGSGGLNGAVDRLVKHNENTLGKKAGAKRLIDSPVEVAQISDIESRSINTSAVVRPFRGTAKYHNVLGYKDGMFRKTIIPLQYLLKGWGDASEGHQGYIHTISHNLGHIRSSDDLLQRTFTDSGNFYYVGITSRNWLVRLDEHVREMHKGNRRLFYKMWQERYGMEDVHFISYLYNVNMTYEEAMNWEEEKVDRIAGDQFRMNMIPGGFKGLKFLHKCNVPH